jgi:integrase/recombinase XerC
MMLYGLGLRISELSGLKLEDIKGEWVQMHGKGSKVRELPLMKVLQKLIERYAEQYAPRKYLFEKGNAPMNAAQLRYKLTKLFRKEGHKNFKPCSDALLMAFLEGLDEFYYMGEEV